MARGISARKKRGKILWTLDKYHHDTYIQVFKRNRLVVLEKHDAGSALQRLSMNGDMTVDILVTGLYMSAGKNPQIQSHLSQFSSMNKRRECAKYFVEIARNLNEAPIFALGVWDEKSREARDIKVAGADKYFNIHKTSHHYLLDQILDELEKKKVDY